MDKCEKFIGKITEFLDQIAGLAILAVMLLTVANILLRVTVGTPILGTYEYIGFLTVIIIGLALAHCAFQNGHIAVEFIMDKFPEKARLPIDFFTHLLSVIFLALASFHIAQYARSMVLTGVVSPTTQTPFYPFVYLAALGLAALCAVLLVRMLKITQKVKTHE